MRNSEYQSREDWQNIMQNRYGLAENLLQKCGQCRHLNPDERWPAAVPWCCHLLVAPGGFLMPWSEKNRACGLFEVRIIPENA